MHIIKISSASFKIILTKEDVEKYRKKYVADDKIDSYGFFCEIKEKTDWLFDYPFDDLSVNAEFFQSKDGGGELFFTAKPRKSVHNYCFKTTDSDMLFKMCTRLSCEKTCCESKLCFYDNNYCLVLSFDDVPGEIIIGIMSEYGDVFKCTQLYIWHLQEHGKSIFELDAVNNVVKNLG